MSDPTNVTVYVSEKQVQDVVGAFGRLPDEGGTYEGYQRLYFEEVDYGGEYEHKKLVEKGSTHIMQWGNGSSYTEGMLVFLGGHEVFMVDCIESTPVVPYIDGEPVEHELERVLRFEKAKNELIEKWKHDAKKDGMKLYVWKVYGTAPVVVVAAAESIDEARRIALEKFGDIVPHTWLDREPMEPELPGAIVISTTGITIHK